MSIDDQSFLAIDDEVNQTSSIPLSVSPFESYHGEFFAKSYPDDVWEVSHRDSHGSAFLCRSPLVPGPCCQQWAVSHSLCRGVATFSTLQDAENHIATLLRLSARQAGDADICIATIEDVDADRD